MTKRPTKVTFHYKKAAKVTKRTTRLSPFLYKMATKVTKRPTKVTFDYKKAAKVTKRTTGLSPTLYKKAAK